MDYTAVGQTTHLAGRMEQMAEPGCAFITASTLRLAGQSVAVKPLGLRPVKGLDAPIEVYELIGATPVRSIARIAAAAQSGPLRCARSRAGAVAATRSMRRSAGPGGPSVSSARPAWANPA